MLVCAAYICDSIWGPWYSSRHTWKLPSLCQVEKCYCLEISLVNRALNLDLKPALNSQFSHWIPLWPLTRLTTLCLAVKQHNLLSRRTNVNMGCDALGNKAANAKINAGDEHIWRDVSFLECNASTGIPLLKYHCHLSSIDTKLNLEICCRDGDTPVTSRSVLYRNHRTCLYKHTLIWSAAAKYSCQ